MFKKLSLSIITGLLAVVVTIALLPQGNAQADLEVRTVSITGALTLKPLATEVFTASGFENGEQVDLLIGGNVANSGNADSSGVYTAAVEIGRTLLFGDVAVQARNDHGEKTGSYTATVEPAIVASVGSGVVSSPFTVEGYGFAQTELYTVTFTDVPDAGQPTCIGAGATITDVLVITGTTTRRGAFSVGAVIPDVTTGAYHLVAIGQTSAICAVD